MKYARWVTSERRKLVEMHDSGSNYPTLAELAAAFPQYSLDSTRGMAQRLGIRRRANKIHWLAIAHLHFMKREAEMRAATILVLLIFWIGLNCGAVFAQGHNGHPPQDQAIHQKFYSNWMMPDSPRTSCCSNEDCFPAQSKFTEGSWYARKTDGDEWTLIPPTKIEQNRDSPDGRSHLCGRRSSFSGDFLVFCFARGGGV